MLQNLPAGIKCMINKISSVSYKNALIQGIQRRFQFTPKIEDLDSILTPFELKELLRKILQIFSMSVLILKMSKPETLELIYIFIQKNQTVL